MSPRRTTNAERDWCEPGNPQPTDPVYEDAYDALQAKLGRKPTWDEYEAYARAVFAKKTAASTAKPPADPAAHRPVEYGPVSLGCSCGWKPKKPSARMSMVAVGYNRHLKSLGIDPSAWTGGEVLIRWGEHAGKTNAEVYPSLYGTPKEGN